MIIYQGLCHIHLHISDSVEYCIESCLMLGNHWFWKLCDWEPGEIRCEIWFEYFWSILIVFYSTKISHLRSLYRSEHHDRLSGDRGWNCIDPDLFSCLTQCCLSKEFTIIDFATRKCPVVGPYLSLVWSLHEKDMRSMLDDEIGSGWDESTRHRWYDIIFQSPFSASLRGTKQSRFSESIPLLFGKK